MSSSYRSSAYELIQVAALQANDVTKFTLSMRKEEKEIKVIVANNKKWKNSEKG
jgi:hypothetical protein